MGDTWLSIDYIPLSIDDIACLKSPEAGRVEAFLGAMSLNIIVLSYYDA